MRTLVVIPAYNEEESIASTVMELERVAPALDFIVINDGSTDRTCQICRSNGYPLINLPVNLGLTCAFQAGLRYARRKGYDAAVQLDADGQHRPEYLEALIDVMERTGADIVIGSRYVSRPSRFCAYDRFKTYFYVYQAHDGSFAIRPDIGYAPVSSHGIQCVLRP